MAVAIGMGAQGAVSEEVVAESSDLAVAEEVGI